MTAATPEIICTVSASGSLSTQDASRLMSVIGQFAGKQIRIEVKPCKRKRSSNQNAYYWSVVIPLITAFFRGHGNYVDGDDTHEFLKLRVGKLAQVIVLPEGEVVKGLGSTAKLTTAEFEDYLERIRAWAAEYGLEIPLPNEPPPL